MRIGRAILLGIFCVLFIVPTVLGQVQSDMVPGNSALLELQLKIIQEINESERRTQDRINEVIDQINTSERRMQDRIDERFNNLSEKIKSRETDLALLNLKINFILWILGISVTVIILPLVVTLVAYGIRLGLQKLVNKSSIGKERSPLNLQIHEDWDSPNSETQTRYQPPGEKNE